MEMSVALLEEPGGSGGNHRSTASNWRHFYTYGPCPVAVPNPGYSGVKPGDLRGHDRNALSHSATEPPPPRIESLVNYCTAMLVTSLAKPDHVVWGCRRPIRCSPLDSSHWRIWHPVIGIVSGICKTVNIWWFEMPCWVAHWLWVTQKVGRAYRYV